MGRNSKIPTHDSGATKTPTHEFLPIFWELEGGDCGKGEIPTHDSGAIKIPTHGIPTHVWSGFYAKVVANEAIQ